MGTMEDAIELASVQADAFAAVGNSLMRQGNTVEARAMWGKATTIRDLVRVFRAQVIREQDEQWHRLMERIRVEPADDVQPLEYRNVDGMVH